MPKNKKTAPLPNIAFTGAKDKKDPLRVITNGDTVIKLPANQSKPFYHKDAKTIIRLYGWLYKPVKNVNRSADSGKFVSREFAENNPSTTYTQKV